MPPQRQVRSILRQEAQSMGYSSAIHDELGGKSGMTIQDLGSIGEVVAALATLATLAYLALQIRQNTRSLRANSYQESVRSANDWSALFIQHPEAIAIFREGLKSPDELEPDGPSSSSISWRVFSATTTPPSDWRTMNWFRRTSPISTQAA